MQMGQLCSQGVELLVELIVLLRLRLDQRSDTGWNCQPVCLEIQAGVEAIAGDLCL